MGQIAKRRKVRSLEEEEAEQVLKTIEAADAVVLSNPALEKHKADLEDHMFETFGADIRDLERSEDFTDAVQVIAPVHCMLEEEVQLGDGKFATRLRKDARDMCINFGSEEEENIALIMKQYILSGTLVSCVKAGCLVDIKETMSSLIGIMSSDADINLAHAARKSLSDILTLSYLDTVPMGTKNGVVIQKEMLLSLAKYREALTQNGCQIARYNKERDNPSQNAEDHVTRLQFIKILLYSISDFGQFLKRNGYVMSETERNECMELTKLIMCLRMDPTSYRMMKQLNSSLLSLCGVFNDQQWNDVLPALSLELATSFGIKSSKGLRFRLVMELPCGVRLLGLNQSSETARCLSLQQSAAAIMVDFGLVQVIDEEIFGVDNADCPPNPTKILKRQAWFNKPSLIVECPETEKSSMNHFIRVEILFKLCDMLLLPHMLTASSAKNPQKILKKDFLQQWSKCLEYIGRKIRGLSPEDAAARAQATALKLHYDAFMDHYYQ